MVRTIPDGRMTRVYSRIGWRPERLATSLPSWPEVIHVGLWEVGEEALAAMRARSGIGMSVLTGPAAHLELRRAR